MLGSCAFDTDTLHRDRHIHVVCSWAPIQAAARVGEATEERGVKRTWHRATASAMRTVMYSSPMASWMWAFSSRRMIWREGLLITGWMPARLWLTTQSCATQVVIEGMFSCIISKRNAVHGAGNPQGASRHHTGRAVHKQEEGPVPAPRGAPCMLVQTEESGQAEGPRLELETEEVALQLGARLAGPCAVLVNSL